MLMVVVDDPEQLQTVLTSKDCLDKPAPIYNGIYFTQGMVVANGDTWKNHRKLIEPSFSKRIVQSFLPTLNEKSKIFVDVLKKNVTHQK